jgi:hypothetical protein
MGEIKRDGTSLGHIVSAELNYSNNLDKVEVIRPDGRIEDADPAMVGVTGTVNVRFADTVLYQALCTVKSSDLSASIAQPNDSSHRLSAQTEDPNPGSRRHPGGVRVAGRQGPGSAKDLHGGAGQRRDRVLTFVTRSRVRTSFPSCQSSPIPRGSNAQACL